MSNDTTSPDMNNRADHWARRMADNSDAVSDAEHAEFQAWLFESEQNELDYRRAVALMQLVADLSPAQQSALISPSGDLRSESARIAGRRNILKFTGLAASAAAALVTGGLFLENRGYFGESHVTRTGETRTVKFSDGSVGYLNTRTEVRWLGTSGNERRVELLSGEALFDVVHDASRPFTVLLDGSEIRVLGTRFNVYRKKGGDVVVTVLEGTVEVRGVTPGGLNPDWTRKVTANQQIEYRPIGLVADPRPTNPLAAVTWREGWYQLPEEGTSLSTVVDELTRYTDQRIVIRDSRVAALKLGGALKFNTRDVSSAMRTLDQLPSAQVRESEGAYVIDYRDPAKERN
jgi:transmembrane sensor